jgi:hypothetical protein
MTNDATRCPVCDIIKIPDGAEWNHDHLWFCDDCLKYLVGYIKYQKELKKDYESYAICRFCNNTGKSQDGSECPH